MSGGGIIETNMFDNFHKAFGDLSFPDNYVGLIECWSKTDFFKSSGADKELFYELSPRPSCYFEFFRILMNNVASKHGKRFWLQKTNPFNGLSCMAHYKDARFVVIKRNIFGVIRSNIQLRINRGGGKKQIGKEVFFYKYQEKLLNKIMKHGNVAFVEYDILKDDPAKCMKAVCESIGINFQETMLKVDFKPNTSFKSHKQRQTVLTNADNFKISIYSKFCDVLPFLVFRIARNILGDSRPLFIPGSFGAIKDKYNMT